MSGWLWGAGGLVCARCAGPVAEGRCAACRQALAEMDAARRLAARVVGGVLAVAGALGLVLLEAARAGT